MADAEKWRRAYDGLMLIATNPDETPARRRKAMAALEVAGRGSGRPNSFPAPIGSHSGGQAMATYLDYEGTWGDQ